MSEKCLDIINDAATHVSVACKLPHGLILQIFDMIPSTDPLPGGGVKPVKRSQARPEKHVLRGYAERYNPSQPPISRGSEYAITDNIPRDFFEKWLKDNETTDIVRNRLVFASDDRTYLVDHLKDHSDTRSGLEPLDPANLPKDLQGAATFNAKEY